jgi:hypothetical protein
MFNMSYFSRFFILIAPYNYEQQLTQRSSEVERLKAKFERLLLLKKEKGGKNKISNTPATEAAAMTSLYARAGKMTEG